MFPMLKNMSAVNDTDKCTFLESEILDVVDMDWLSTDYQLSYTLQICNCFDVEKFEYATSSIQFQTHWLFFVKVRTSVASLLC